MDVDIQCDLNFRYRQHLYDVCLSINNQIGIDEKFIFFTSLPFDDGNFKSYIPLVDQDDLSFWEGSVLSNAYEIEKMNESQFYLDREKKQLEKQKEKLEKNKREIEMILDQSRESERIEKELMKFIDSRKKKSKFRSFFGF